VNTEPRDDPSAPSPAALLAAKTPDRRPTDQPRVPRPEDAGRSQILFTADTESERLRSILDYLGGQAILTVGETAQFADGGGVIGFRLEDDRVRLDVNLSAAQRSGLRISSELLKLARIVGMLPTED
jgi:hypothetical protein